MKSLFIFTAAFLFSIQSFAQAPAIQWQKSLGGSKKDLGKSIQPTADGGCIVVGQSDSNDGDVSGHIGNSDFWIVKLNNSGEIEWEKSLGGSASDSAESIIKTSDGGYIIAGNSASHDGDVSTNQGGFDYWIVKIDISGNIQWEKSYGGSKDESPSSIKQTTDGGYIIAGYSESNDGDVSENKGARDYWIIKIDNSGNLQWERAYGGSQIDLAQSIQQTVDGGYIVAGTSSSNDGDVIGNHGHGDFWILKLDSSGNIEWQKSLGGSEDDFGFSIQLTTDGGFIVAGASSSNDGDITGNHGGFDYWVVKLDQMGNIDWQKSLGGTNLDSGQSIQQTTDGGYIVLGFSISNNGDVTGNHGYDDFWTVKLDNSGNIKWQKSLGGSDFEFATEIRQTSDGGYIMTGDSNSNDGDLTENHGTQDYWIVKLERDALGVLDMDNEEYFSIYPNPVRNTLMISGISPNTKIMISGLNGEIIKEFTAKDSLESIDVSGLPAGVYFVNGKKFIKK